VLLLINGAPGVGKSTLAQRYADDHALALIVDIDDIRRHLGRWADVQESKLVARDLAIALAEHHLRRGHDVIVPQFLGRPDFRERLRGLAATVGTSFVEVIITDDPATVVERFRTRRNMHALTGSAHPEAEVVEESIENDVRDAMARLLRDATDRDVPVISLAAGMEAALIALVGQVASTS